MSLTINGTNGIETNTDTGKIKVGASDDLQIYASGSNSIIAHNGDGNLQITTGASGEDILVQAYGDIDLKPANGENGVKIIGNGATSLYYDNSKKFETYASGTITTGNLKNTGSVYVGNQVDGHDGNSTGQLFFGASNDLKMYHDGTDATIKNITGDLKIEALGGTSDDILISANDDFVLKVAATETAITASANGGVALYDNDVLKFSTNGGGCRIPDNNVLGFGDGDDLQMYHSSSNATNYFYASQANQNTRHQYNNSGGTWRVETTAADKRILCDTDTAVHLYYNGSRKWATHSNGTFAYTMLPFNDNADDLGHSSYRWDDVYATNGSIQTSDKNEKNTIVESDLGLSFVNKLKPVSYKFNTGTRTHYGLIAQDVETTLSDISKTTTEFAGFIKEDTPDIKYDDKEDLPEGKKPGDIKYAATTKHGLRYTEFISPLVKAIQELSAEVETLKTKVAALEAA